MGGTYGDEVVFVSLPGASSGWGWDRRCSPFWDWESTSLSTLSHDQVRQEYRPLMDGRSAPGEVGTLASLAPAPGAGRQ